MSEQTIIRPAEPAQESVAAPFTNDVRALVIVTAVFFMWGLITSLNDIIIPHLKAIFDLDYAQAMLIQFCFFSTYFVFALPFGKLLEAIGFKGAIVTGLFTAGVGALLFVPAAMTASFVFFLGALIVLAAGITGLQVAANPYISILGHPRTASSRLNLAQALNSLGTTLGPYVGGLLILSGAPMAADAMKRLAPGALHAYRTHEAASVIGPYIGIASVLVLLAIGIALAKLPKMEAERRADADPEKPAAGIWRYRHTVLGALGIFLYVGAEVAIGSFLVNYFNQPDTGGLPVRTAAKFVAIYWFCAMVGRFIGSAALRKISAGVALGAVAIIAGLLVTASMLTTGYVAMATILAVGLFNSIMFPNIFTLGIADLGPLTGEGSGLLIAAIVGGAVVPLAEGALADRIGIHHAFILPVLCYAYLVFYGFRGSQPQAVGETA